MLPGGQGGRPRARRRAAARRGGALLAGVAILSGVVGRVETPAPALSLLAAREVRTIDTRELGLASPQDIAYVPADGSLVVVGTTDGATRSLRVTTGGDLINGRASPDGKDHDGPAIQVASGGDAPTAADLAAIGLADPEGIAHGADSGEWDVLDGESQTVVGVAIEGSSVAVTRRTSLRGLGAARLQGLARHPTTGALYVAAPVEDRIIRLDGRGEATASYRLVAPGPLDLRAMTFAPSADTTDDPAQHNLFIADAGAGTGGGAVREMSLEQGVTLAATAPTVSAQLMQMIATSQFNPASPDPAGIVYLPGRDRMAIVDSEVDETTGAGYHGVNLWELTRTGTVTNTGSTWTGGANFSREPTGLGFDPATNTLFVSDDSGKRVWLDRPGADTRFGTADDTLTFVNALAYGSGDTEDPKFDTATGHLFFVDGTNKEVYRIDPVNGVFGDGNDAMTQLDVAQFGAVDPEGLAIHPSRGTLLVGDRAQDKIYEITKDGVLVRIISTSGISGLTFISGLATGPASDGSGRTSYWVVDRAVDNGNNSNENDGKIFELRVDDGPAGTPPVAVADSASTPVNQAVTINVAANDSDPDGNLAPATVTVTATPNNGTATPNGNGTVTYTPALSFSGSDSFTYRICDTTGLCATAVVTVTVTAVGDPPVAVADSAGTIEDTAVTIDVAANDSDPDGNLNPATVTVTVAPSRGSASPNGDGTITYTPTTNLNGSDAFTYRICDTTGLCATATVTVTVTAVDDPPVAAPDSASTPANQAVTINVAANDSDPDGNLAPATVTVTADPSHGTATPNGDGTVTYTPGLGFSGSDAFTYRICDSTGLCATATGTILEAVPYHLSFTDSSTLPGITGTVRDEDIVTYRPGVGWTMLFDASDMGITDSDLSDFHVRADGSILMAFHDGLVIPGLVGGPEGTLIDDSDIVLFTPTSIGSTTAGSFSFFLDGSDVGLDATSEDVDSLHELADGTLLISTNGNATVPGLTKTQDKDLLRFTPTALGAVTAGTFTLHFDGSDVGLTAGTDDIDAIALDSDGGLLFSTVGQSSFGTADEDINRFTGTFGPTTTGTNSLELALAAVGVSPANNVDGLALDP